MWRMWMVLGLMSLVACGEDASKGAEEDPLTAGKDDSFFRPTEHGAMRFGVSNPASISDDQKFHAWTFELSGEATVDLATEVSANLDTVMYLYHRATPGASWGQYIAKNDDDGRKISSRIRTTVGAGEYRVVVKGFKSALRGGFSLEGTCEGDGCVVSSTTCESGVYAALPDRNDMTSECAASIGAILGGKRVSESSTSVALDDKCQLSGVELLATDYYVEWWSELVDFDEQFDYGDGVEVELTTERFATGTVVTLNGGGDEDGITFVFDADDALLAMYQHNQSPVSEYFCAPGTSVSSPDEGCFGDALELRHDVQESQSGASNVGDLPNGVLARAGQFFIDLYGASTDEYVEYVLDEYNEGRGATVKLSSSTDTARVHFVDVYPDGLVPRLVEAGDQSRFVCE